MPAPKVQATHAPADQDKGQPKADTTVFKVIATNRKAHHEYELFDSYEAGLVLMGSEVKSLRLHGAALDDGFVIDRGDELFLMQVNIAEYGFGSKAFEHEPRRPRKLLLHKKEIAKLMIGIRERGYSIVPTRMYFKGGRAKVEIALGRGKKLYDKRAAMADKDSKRDIQRALKEHNRE